MRGAEAVQRLLRRARFLRRWGDHEDLLPHLRRPLEILLAEGAHDAHVQERLRVSGIDRERAIELGECAVRLVHVVVGDAQVGAGVDVLRMDLQRCFVPVGGFLEPARVEVHVGQLHAGDGIRGILLRRGLHRGRARLVERRRRGRVGPAGGRLAGGGGRRRRRRRPAGPLLGADNPTDEHAEKDARHAHNQGIFRHCESRS